MQRGEENTSWRLLAACGDREGKGHGCGVLFFKKKKRKNVKLVGERTDQRSQCVGFDLCRFNECEDLVGH